MHFDGKMGKITRRMNECESADGGREVFSVSWVGLGWVGLPLLNFPRPMNSFRAIGPVKAVY